MKEITIGFILDLIIGDPQNPYHPIRFIGNMIPVPDSCLTQLKYNQVDNFRSFKNPKEKTDYIYLLQKEKAMIDNIEKTLQNKALKLYQKCISKPDSSLATRCCNFKLLEEKCNLYPHT